MLTLENISVTIHGKLILDNLSCKIKQGDFVVLVGANGSGKSTLFDTISGRKQPSRGEIFFEKENITHVSERQRARFIGRLFQNVSLNIASSMTVEQNLAMASYKGKIATLANSKAHLKKYSNLFAEYPNFELMTKAFFQKTMGSLSGGQQQLIAFIMATLIPPKLLLLDEPTTALDPKSATQLLLFAVEYIKKHNLTTLLITHDPELAKVLGTKLWVLSEGKIVKQLEKKKEGASVPEELIGKIDYNALGPVEF